MSKPYVFTEFFFSHKPTATALTFSATYILRNLKRFINESGLLNNVYLHNISSEGVYFKDSNGETVSVTAMSDGFRSILSLIFELIRQMLRVYHFHNVFKHLEKGAIKIDLESA